MTAKAAATKARRKGLPKLGAQKSGVKLTGDERRSAIVAAVRRVFAEKGFHGTTTRELAREAGVSEALLFKHFPNKQALYAAMLVSCSQHLGEAMFERLQALEPCGSSLVVLVHIVVSNFITKRLNDDDETAIQTRLMLHSILDDGEFARLRLRQVGECWIPKIEECLKAAIAAGEAAESPGRLTVRGWLAHQLAAGVKIHLLPAGGIIDFEVTREQLVEQTVWFALRGMGMTDAAIKRHYNAKALALFSG
ncbi:MAG TPA: helix-turn-helix domain-containing protein [Pirellulales bacterium]